MFSCTTTDAYFPVIVAYDVIRREKFKSLVLQNKETVIDCEINRDVCSALLLDGLAVKAFVRNVIAGLEPVFLISEDRDRHVLSTKEKIGASVKSIFQYLFEPELYTSYVIKVMGSNAERICFDFERDVLLAVFNSDIVVCHECLQLEPMYDVLARSFAAESRVVIAKTDIAGNELPGSWNITSYPALLWFPAKKKSSSSNSQNTKPTSFWDQPDNPYKVTYLEGVMPHVIEFRDQILAKSSFAKNSLRVASDDQLGSLLSDVETIVTHYEYQYEKKLRNYGRYIYSDVLMDYLLGEVVWNGHRIDIIFLFLAFILGCCMRSIIVWLFFHDSPAATRNSPSCIDISTTRATVGSFAIKNDKIDCSESEDKVDR